MNASRLDPTTTTVAEATIECEDNTKEQALSCLEAALDRLCDPRNLDQRKTQVVWISSSESGLGETELIQKFEKRVQEESGVVLVLDCDNGCHTDIFEPVIRALAEWVRRSEKESRNVDAIGIRLEQSMTLQERQFLAGIIPQVKEAFQWHNQEDLPRSQVHRRQQASLFRSFFGKIIFAVASIQPCVLVMKDLHHANECILDMLDILIRAEDMKEWEMPFLCLGTYRSDSDDSMVVEWVRGLKDKLAHTKVEQAEIAMKMYDSVLLRERVSMIAGIDAKSLSLPFWSRNPYLAGLCLEKLVSELSEDDKQFLRIFSCLGAKTTQILLSQARASDSLDNHLQSGIRKGILVVHNEIRGEYGFSHSVIRDLVYDTIPVEDRPAFHYQIAENVWLSFDLENLNEHLLILVDHLLKGQKSIPGKRHRAAVARLCLRAGERSAEVSAYNTSFRYFSSGIEILSNERVEGGWEDEYEICLALHSAACEVGYCVARFEDIHRLADAVITKARSLNDSLRAQISMIYTIGTEHPRKGLRYGDSLLFQLGEGVGSRSTKKQARVAMSRVRRRLKSITIDQILRMRSMQDSKKLTTMKILNCLLPWVFTVDPLLTPIILEKMISFTLDYGTSPVSAVGFGDIKSAQKYGDFALQLAQKFEADAWMARAAAFYYATTFCWGNAFQEAVAPLQRARRVAFAYGDVEFALLSTTLLSFVQFNLLPIPDLVAAIRESQATMKRYGQQVNLKLVQPQLYLLLTCSGDIGRDFSEWQGTPEGMMASYEAGDRVSLTASWIHYFRMTVALIFHDFQEACRCSRNCDDLLENPTGCGDITMPCLLDCVLSVEMIRQNRCNGSRLLRVRKRIRQLHRLAKESPLNVMGKLHLAQAEVASTCGRRERAYMKYVSAIALSEKSGFLFQTALANELAGKHFLRFGSKDLATRYLNEAVRVYHVWGATAKVNHLVAELGLA
eukprot:scaffold2155_cov162-Amphora_coffeaeformis.AAC.7